MTSSESRAALFVEEQKFTQIWLWLLVGIIALMAWAAFVQQIIRGTPVGTHPAPDLIVWIILALFGVGLPWLFLVLKLVTRLEADRLVIRFRPLITRTVSLADITSCEAVTYRPLRDFGGWGLRFSPKHGRAYNASGDKGVQLVLADGKKVLIGSQKAHPLADAINKNRQATR